jgi:hypothetical protein
MPTTSTYNFNFELGDTGWTKGSGWAINTGEHVFEGSYRAKQDSGIVVSSELINDHFFECVPGVDITASCKVDQGLSDAGEAGVAVKLYWYDSDQVLLSVDTGSYLSSGENHEWGTASISATAPANTAFVKIGCDMFRNAGSDYLLVDSFEWDFVFDRTITLLSPEDGDVYTVGSNVSLQVALTGSDPDIDYVAYFSDLDGEIASTSSGTYSYNVSDLSVGTHVIHAEAGLDGGGTISSPSVTITVQEEAIEPIIREFKASNSYSYLVAKNFSGVASAIPSTALIKGIEVLIDYKLEVLVRSKDIDVDDPAGANSDVIFDITNDANVEAVLLTGEGSDYTKTGSAITNSVPLVRSDFDLVEEGTSEGKKWTWLRSGIVTTVLGGEDSLFNLEPIATADFLTRSLGIRFFPNLVSKPAYADSGDACVRFLIDKLRLRVYFDAGSAEYYFASADKTKVIKGVLVASNVVDGDFRNADAVGVLQLREDLTVMDGTQTWIGDDWTIHAAYPPTDANQIGTVAAREADDGIGMSYNGLPTADAIVANRSRYSFITANFYAVKSLDSIYGTHGLPRAFAYNGDFFYKIYTQPDADKDQPRHVAYNAGHLALGFDDGRVDLSVVGQPYNYDGAQGASEWSIGDAVTGLLPLSGTLLGIFGSKSIQALSGTTVDNFATQVITPNIGAIEYTVTDMGFPVYANAYGIYTLSQTQQYGDYLGTPMSQDISPWLRPRLVRKYTSDKEVVAAWPVRSKNQYKLAFSDGYTLSMTLNAGQQSAPTFSFQQYTIYSEEDE